ncbi:hypothetical protein B0H19DRAFT_1144923 [Mycena capillaripes]|nr:hypothetical protein B0H19DRAFT_1144923 [Mycena capillaripes]
MFEPFEDVRDFYPGLIVWCDPTCYETDFFGGHSPLSKYDRKKSRELRPCMVISVNPNSQTFQAARLSATTVSLLSKEIDSLTTHVCSRPTRPSGSESTARLRLLGSSTMPGYGLRTPPQSPWFSTTPRSCIVSLGPLSMHRVCSGVGISANRDAYYSAGPVATTNLQNYWVHRQAYINRQSRGLSVVRQRIIALTREMQLRVLYIILLKVPTRDPVSVIITLIARPRVPSTQAHRRNIKHRHMQVRRNQVSTRRIPTPPYSTLLLRNLSLCPSVSPKLTRAFRAGGAIHRLAYSGMQIADFSLHCHLPIRRCLHSFLAEGSIFLMLPALSNSLCANKWTFSY